MNNSNYYNQNGSVSYEENSRVSDLYLPLLNQLKNIGYDNGSFTGVSKEDKVDIFVKEFLEYDEPWLNKEIYSIDKMMGILLVYTEVPMIMQKKMLLEQR